MHQREKVIRKIKGKEQVVDFVFGSGYLTANPPEIKNVTAYKVMSGFGFSIKFSNGKDKKPTYYALELWGNNAEHMARLGFEGQLIEVAGRVTVKKYTSKGEAKELKVLTVECFTCLDRKDKEESKKTIVSEEQTVEDNEVEEDTVDDNAVEKQTVIDKHVGIESTGVENAKDDDWDGIPF